MPNCCDSRAVITLPGFRLIITILACSQSPNILLSLGGGKKWGNFLAKHAADTPPAGAKGGLSGNLAPIMLKQDSLLLDAGVGI